jgi:hypothetical protein
MKKILLSIATAVVLPFLVNAQSPGGVEQSSGVKPAIWLKGNAGITPNTNNAPITGWANSGSIAFTLLPGSTAPTYTTDGSANFGTNAALNFSQGGTELSSILGDGTAGKKYEIFIVGSNSSASAPYFYLGGSIPTISADATPILNHLNFGARAVYYNNDNTGTAEGDGETGYYNNETGAYVPNIGNQPSELSITNIMSHPNNAYSDINSLVFSVNGFAATKQTDGTTATSAESNTYWGKGPSYGSGTPVYNINAQRLFLGGKLNYTGTDLDPARKKPAKIFEIIVYNRKLTVEERQKVYSYLAIKYKIYLSHDQGAFSANATAPGTNVGNGETVNNGYYFSSDGTVIFSRDAANITDTKDYKAATLANGATSFIKDVYYPLNSSSTNNQFSFFGRDDASGLLTNAGQSTVGAYFETFPKSNSTLNADKQFMMLSTNNASMTYTTDNMVAPYPSSAGVLGRMSRTWKISSSKYKNSFTFNGNSGGAAFLTAGSGNIGNPSTNVVLLVSRDPSFPADGTTSVPVNTTGGNFLDAKPNMTTLFGSAAETQQITFYVTFAITNGSPTLLSTLPVEITSFTAKAKGNTVGLNWTTASEKNSSHFVITRSTDAKNFSSIARVEAAGNSNAAKTYSYTDNTPFAGTNYYQLQQVDLNGDTQVSKVVNARVTLSSTKLIVKNVNATSVTLAVAGANAGKGHITASNALGQVIANQSVDFSNGNTPTVNTGSAKGLIIFTLNTENGTISKKMVK